jgi:hypothetical protein
MVLAGEQREGGLVAVAQRPDELDVVEARRSLHEATVTETRGAENSEASPLD